MKLNMICTKFDPKNKKNPKHLHFGLLSFFKTRKPYLSRSHFSAMIGHYLSLNARWNWRWNISRSGPSWLWFLDAVGVPSADVECQAAVWVLQCCHRVLWIQHERLASIVSTVHHALSWSSPAHWPQSSTTVPMTSSFPADRRAIDVIVKKNTEIKI